MTSFKTFFAVDWLRRLIALKSCCGEGRVGGGELNFLWWERGGHLSLKNIKQQKSCQKVWVQRPSWDNTSCLTYDTKQIQSLFSSGCFRATLMTENHSNFLLLAVISYKQQYMSLWLRQIPGSSAWAHESLAPADGEVLSSSQLAQHCENNGTNGSNVRILKSTYGAVEKTSGTRPAVRIKEPEWHLRVHQ